MVEYNKYPEYKDSGVQWLGEIPADWNARKVENAATFFTGGTPPTTNQEYFDGDNIWVNISDLNNEEIYDSKKHISDSGVKAANIVISPKGSLLFSFKLSVGKVAIAGKDLYTNEAIATFVPKDTLDTKFAFYSFPCTLIKAAKKNIYNANLLNAAMIREAKFPLPPLKTQKQIVAFLDAETKKIDDSVSSMESLISLLTEKRAALISETVTRGVPGEHAEFKDSGVEWLGEIPVGWELCRLGYYFSEKSTRLNGGTKVPLLSVTQSKGIVRRDTITDKEPRAEDLNNYKVCELGDVVLSRFNAYRGALGVAKEKGIVSPDYMVVRPANYTAPLFLEYLLKSSYLGNSMKLTMGGIGSSDPDASGFSRISAHDLMRFKVPKLSIESQERIVAFIETETQNIDLLLGEANKAIKLLKEKRQTLISDVVTGKIDVTNAVE